jgi:rhodanese-related sulfurtransferase
MKRFTLALASLLVLSFGLSQANPSTELFGQIINEASQAGWLQINVEASLDFIEQVEPFILDVRRQDEFDLGYIDFAVLIPVVELAGRLGELPSNLDTPMIVYCAAGTRGMWALSLLKLAGYTNVRNMSGGFNAWKAAGYPVVD